MANYSASAHWRDSARFARFFLVDARCAFPFLFFLMHIKLWSFMLALVAMVTFSLIERKGFSVPVFIRVLRSYLAGQRKITRPWWK